MIQDWSHLLFFVITTFGLLCKVFSRVDNMHEVVPVKDKTLFMLLAHLAVGLLDYIDEASRVSQTLGRIAFETLN